MNEKRIMILSEFWKIYEAEGIKTAIEYLQLSKNEDEDDSSIEQMMNMIYI